jgi:glycosyltransferase involved in cell wall biosynthesis
MVAEFSDYKDYPTFIRAAQQVLSRRKDVLFVAVGGGKNLEVSKQMIQGHENSFRFLGERKDVESLIQQMDIGVLCTFTEGISNSVMEYMAAEKPVVVTNGGGTVELIADGEHGFLVPPSAPESVAEKIELLLDDPARAKAMGVAGRRRLEECFSLKQLVENHLRMYQEVLQVRG